MTVVLIMFAVGCALFGVWGVGSAAHARILVARMRRVVFTAS